MRSILVASMTVIILFVQATEVALKENLIKTVKVDSEQNENDGVDNKSLLCYINVRKLTLKIKGAVAK